MEEYLKSELKKKHQLGVARHMDHMSPATRLLEKHQEMVDVQNALEAEIEEFARVEERIKLREEELKRRDLELQESLVKFNKFLQENDSKRTRAEKKALAEIRLREQKEEEIEKIKEQMEDLKRQKVHFAEVLAKDMRYQDYLDRVLEVAEEYPETNDVLMRYYTLRATNSDLVERARQCAQENEDLRQQLQKYTEEKTNEILGYNILTSTLQKQLEEAEMRALHVQSTIEKRLTEAADKKRETGQIVRACQNLLQRVIARSMIKREETSDTKQQLKIIGDYVGDLLNVVKQYQYFKKPAGGGRGDQTIAPPVPTAAHLMNPPAPTTVGGSTSMATAPTVSVIAPSGGASTVAS